MRQQSRGAACYGVLKDRLRFFGPVHPACSCTPEDIPRAPAVFLEVVKKPQIPGQDVWPVAPSNMWQAEHAGAMCTALQEHATALPRAPAAQSSSNRSATSLAMLHGGPRAWCWVIPWGAPSIDVLRGWAAEVGVRSGCGLIVPTAQTRCRPPS